MHHSAWSQQQNWPGWGGGDGWGYEGYEGYGGDGWGGWDDPALWNACAAWHGKGGCGGYPAGSMGGQILVGTVKSYSSVKGFGFLIHSDIAQDIWFAKETVAAEYRTSDLAGTSMSFELIRAQDGKPQARNLRPAPSGMPPPPVNPNQHVPVSRFDQRPGFPPPALMRPGMPGMMPGMAGMPGMGVGVGMGVGMAMGMRPAGMPGMAAPGQPKRRAWSPHAGSRAIATASKDDQVPGMVQPPVEAKKSESEERSKSSSRRSSEPSSSSSDKKKKKKKKDKKKKKKKKKKSKKSDRCSSSSLEEVQSSKSRRRSRSPRGESAPAKPKSTPEIEQAKLEALEKLRKLQSIEPKEARAKEWRALLRDWHPDKNPDKIEVAKEVFQFLQKGKTIINV